MENPDGKRLFEAKSKAFHTLQHAVLARVSLHMSTLLLQPRSFNGSRINNDDAARDGKKDRKIWGFDPM